VTPYAKAATSANGRTCYTSDEMLDLAAYKLDCDVVKKNYSDLLHSHKDMVDNCKDESFIGSNPTTFAMSVGTALLIGILFGANAR
jgi:hypothetical protein